MSSAAAVDVREDADAVARRYGNDGPARIAWNDVLGLLLAHRSVRSYSAQPIEEGALEAIVAAAQSAATSSNLQLWSVIAIRNAERKAALARLAGGQAHIIQAPLFLVWVADLARARGIAARHAPAQTHVSNAQDAQGDASALDYVESLVVAVADAALAAQNAVVALESLGLGSVYIGALRNHVESVAALLELPPLTLPLFGLCVGYAHADSTAAVKPRLPQSVVLHHETYSPTLDPDVLRRYDDTLEVFQRTHGQPAGGWRQRVTDRVRASTLNGREHLRRALDHFGLALR